MTDRRLAENINQLIRDGLRGNGLFEAPNTQPAISAGSGTGRREEKPGEATTEHGYTERIVIYSKVLVQEDGAYELPNNWPSTPASYSGQSFPEDQLPDPDAPYLIVRRVHAYALSQDGAYTASYPTHRLLTYYEQPFDTAQRLIWPGQGDPAITWRPTTYAALYNDAPSWDRENRHYQAIAEIAAKLRGEYQVA